MSLKPGQGVHGEITNPPALATGVVQNPMTPVEYGRTAEKSKYTVTDDTSALPDFGSGSSGDASGTLTGLTVAGDATVSNGDTRSYTSSVAGTDVNTAAGTYLWTVTGVAATIATASAANTDITFNATGTASVTCTYTEAGVTGSPVDNTLTVTVS